MVLKMYTIIDQYTLIVQSLIYASIGEGQLRSCVATFQTCRVTYEIDSLKLGTEHEQGNEQLFIFINTTQSSGYHNIREGEAIKV